MAGNNANPLWQQIISKVGMPSTGSGGAGGGNKSTSQPSTSNKASKYKTPSNPETPVQKTLREADTPIDQDESNVPSVQDTMKGLGL